MLSLPLASSCSPSTPCPCAAPSCVHEVTRDACQLALAVQWPGETPTNYSGLRRVFEHFLLTCYGRSPRDYHLRFQHEDGLIVAYVSDPRPQRSRRSGQHRAERWRWMHQQLATA